MPESSIVQLLSYILESSDDAFEKLNIKDITEFWQKQLCAFTSNMAVESTVAETVSSGLNGTIKGKSPAGKKGAKKKAKGRRKSLVNGDHDWSQSNGHTETNNESVCDMEVDETHRNGGE